MLNTMPRLRTDGAGYESVRLRSSTKARIDAEQLRLRNLGQRVPVSDLMDAALDALEKRPKHTLDLSGLSADDQEVVRVVADMLSRDDRLSFVVRGVAGEYSHRSRRKKL